ncbi:zinc ribbon domain-containing protein [Anaerotruncus colihominis]|uniref:zinc ribbon domain-containing protein n=1 Tax=Anaerotruncus colihominis TaxID=169435 RepID=UPI0026EE1871|nr:zinc ribbon domain-containing protein [Anaerotruncus colihominis]
MVCPSCGRRIPRKSQYCLHCGAPAAAFKSSDENGDGSPVRTCILCGGPLSEDSTADVCEPCLSGQTPLHPMELEPELLPAFEESAPDDPVTAKKHLPMLKWLLFIFILLAAVAAALFFLRSHNAGDSIGHTSSAVHTTALSDEEQYAVSCAQEMVTAAAYNPGSVHFRKSDLSVQFDGSFYTVTQTFDRKIASGESVTQPYTAVLSFNGGTGGGYKPLSLKVGDDLLYDYRTAQ